MPDFKFVCLAEIEFPNESPNEELMKELEKTAFLKGASIKVVDEFYHEKKR
jgi:hypothetical protein